MHYKTFYGNLFVYEQLEICYLCMMFM